MKTSHKIIFGALTAVTAAAAGTAALKSKQAKKQERSLKSLLLEDASRMAPIAAKKPIDFETALENSAVDFVLPQSVRNTIGMTELDELTDTFVLEPKKKTTDRVIFYLHGSDYWNNPSRVHYSFVKRLANRTGAELILPVYPKAPAHTAAEVLQMLTDRYMYLINEKEIPAENIVFIGDAAGGGLALALMQKLRFTAQPMPGQAFLLSPWLDITNSNPEIEQLQANDTVLNAERLRFKGEKYAGDLELTHPFVSPLGSDLNGLPPITVYAGSKEIFSADVIKLEELAEEKNLAIDVIIYNNQMHFFVGLPIPESEKVLDEIAAKLNVKAIEETVEAEEEPEQEPTETENAKPVDEEGLNEDAIGNGEDYRN